MSEKKENGQNKAEHKNEEKKTDKVEEERLNQSSAPESSEPERKEEKKPEVLAEPVQPQPPSPSIEADLTRIGREIFAEGDIGRELEGELRWLRSVIDFRMKKWADDLRAKMEKEHARNLADVEKKLQAEWKEREMQLRTEFDEMLRKREAELERLREAEVARREDEVRLELETKHRREREELKNFYEEEARKREEELRNRLETAFKAREEELRKMWLEEAKTKEIELEKKLRKDFEEELKRRERALTYQLKISPYPYPFTAIVGQERMKRALILNAINPRIGGVLLWGRRGNGKSTALLGFARLIAGEKKKEEMRAWNDPERYLAGIIPGKNTSLTYVIDSSLNVGVVSVTGRESKHAFPSLLLDRTHLYDEKVMHYLHSQTLHIEVRELEDIEQRTEVVRRKKEYDTDPEKFYRRYQSDENNLRERIIKAIQLLPLVTVSTKLSTTITKMCMLDKRSSHIDILVEEIAKTLAAYEGRTHVTADDVEEAADMVLLHRVERVIELKPLEEEKK